MVDDRKTGPCISLCLRLWQCECVQQLEATFLRIEYSRVADSAIKRVRVRTLEVQNFARLLATLLRWWLARFPTNDIFLRLYLNVLRGEKQRIKEKRNTGKEETRVICYSPEWLCETAIDATVWKDDRVAVLDHHGPKWPTHHVTVLFSRIAKSTGESSHIRAYFTIANWNLSFMWTTLLCNIEWHNYYDDGCTLESMSFDDIKRRTVTEPNGLVFKVRYTLVHTVWVWVFF